MRRIPSALLAVLLLCAPAALHAAPSDARGAIQAAYDSMNTGYMQKDLAKAFAYRIGTSEKDRYETSVLFAEFVSLRATSTVQSVSYSRSGQAVVKVREATAATYLNPNTLRPTRLSFKDTARDIWVATSQGWRQKSSTTLTGSGTVDGKIKAAF